MQDRQRTGGDDMKLNNMHEILDRMISDRCECSCHDRGKDGMPYAVHCIPCCCLCPYCERNIIRHRYEKHLKDEEEYLKLQK